MFIVALKIEVLLTSCADSVDVDIKRTNSSHVYNFIMQRNRYQQYLEQIPVS